MEEDIGQWAVGLLLLTIFSVVLYWLKKTRDSLRRRPPVSCQPPKIFTDQYWPVKNAILEHLELEDLLNLKNAYPSLQLQLWEEKQRKKFLHEVQEFREDSFIPCHLGHGLSHSGHPIFNAIRKNAQQRKKMEEIKEMISKFGPDINKIPRVKPNFDGTLETQNIESTCALGGFTPLMYCGLLNDLDVARLLVESGSDIYQTGGPFQENCLHTAARLNSLYVTEYLIEELKMDKERLNSHGQTALDVADEDNERMKDQEDDDEAVVIMAQRAHEVLQLLTD